MYFIINNAPIPIGPNKLPTNIVDKFIGKNKFAPFNIKSKEYIIPKENNILLIIFIIIFIN